MLYVIKYKCKDGEGECIMDEIHLLKSYYFSYLIKYPNISVQNDNIIIELPFKQKTVISCLKYLADEQYDFDFSFELICANAFFFVDYPGFIEKILVKFHKEVNKTSSKKHVLNLFDLLDQHADLISSNHLKNIASCYIVKYPIMKKYMNFNNYEYSSINEILQHEYWSTTIDSSYTSYFNMSKNETSRFHLLPFKDGVWFQDTVYLKYKMLRQCPKEIYMDKFTNSQQFLFCIEVRDSHRHIQLEKRSCYYQQIVLFDGIHSPCNPVLINRDYVCYKEPIKFNIEYDNQIHMVFVKKEEFEQENDNEKHVLIEYVLFFHKYAKKYPFGHLVLFEDLKYNESLIKEYEMNIMCKTFESLNKKNN